MVSISSIPQELLDHIIDEARDDWGTLNACSLVSRAFLSTSRKNLFCAVTIHNRATCQGLHNLLSSNPAIASYVQELTIVPHPKILRSILPGVPWVVLDQQLAPILYALPQVQQLQLGDDTSHLFDWTYFPPPVQLALRAQICRLTGLSILKVFHISELPVACFCFAPIKQLSLLRVNIADTDIPEESLTDDHAMAQLESLDVLVYDFRQDPNITWPLLFRCSLNLRHLSVLSLRNSGNYGFRVARQLIEVAATSLNSVACLVYDDDPIPLLEHYGWPRLNLGLVSNLTTLSFTFTTLSMNENPCNFSGIINVLKDPLVTRNLNTLTFAFEMTYTTYMWESRVALCSRYDAWVEFNQIFESGPGIPALRNLTVYLYLTEPPSRAADARLQSSLVSILPGLNEQVTLSCVTYSNDN